MKTLKLLLFLKFLFVFIDCKGQIKEIGEEKPKIDFIITNDYMSERNLSFMGGMMPTNYKNKIQDSLQNSFIELYDNNNNIVEKKYYNKVGALYLTIRKSYDSKKRLEKSVEINEFKNDTCTTNFKYSDSLNLLTQKLVNTPCENISLDFYYKYNEKGERSEEVLYQNDTLIYKKSIQKISKKEVQIKSYDQANRLSNYVYKYNDKDLLIYEKRNEWVCVIKDDYFETSQENEFLYKYDKNGNWIERTKQSYCLPKRKLTQTKKTNKKELPAKIDSEYINTDNCEHEIKEKLIRKIFYK